MGIVAPNGFGVTAFTKNLRKGVSGIKTLSLLSDMGFSCTLAAVPVLPESQLEAVLSKYNALDAGDNIKYSLLAALEAWQDAGLPIPDPKDNMVDYDTGIVVGSGVGNIDMLKNHIFPMVDTGKHRRLKSAALPFTMFNGASAVLAGILALGNSVGANASACASGVESVLWAYDLIKSGKAKRMIAGSTEIPSPYIWSWFDSMRLMPSAYNHTPTTACRPMSATAKGFVAGAGAAFLVIEDEETAIKRNAHIYAEIAGGHINSGGQRNGGSMFAPNSEAVQKCITNAINDASLKPKQIDLICGHLTATMADPIEIENWSKALGVYGDDFPFVSAIKATTGHCIGAAGAIEIVASVAQLYHNFLAPNINCNDLHPDITKLVNPSKILHKTVPPIRLNNVVKASFGFGDINACIVLKRFS